MRLIDDLDDPRFGYETTDEHGRTWRYIARGQLFGTSYAPEVTVEVASQRLRLRAIELAEANGGRDVKMAFHPPTGAWQAWLLVEGEVMPGERRNDLRPEAPPELPPSRRFELDGVDITDQVRGPSITDKARFGYYGDARSIHGAYSDWLRRSEAIPQAGRSATRRCAGLKANGCPCGYRVKAPRTYCKRHDPAEWEVDPLTGWTCLPNNAVPEAER